MPCFPYFDNMSVHDFYYLPTDTKIISCSVFGCKYIGIDKCKKRLCNWKFCQYHCDHKHHVCSANENGEGCNNFGTHGLAHRSDCTVCDYHKNMYEQNRLKNNRIMCSMCRKKEGKYSGYCDVCFAIQISLHRKGLPSLFGQGK